jgi:hypothetical protein
MRNIVWIEPRTFGPRERLWLPDKVCIFFRENKEYNNFQSIKEILIYYTYCQQMARKSSSLP